MKAVILAGGFGTRLSEETDRKPKPMVEIGPFPIIWHIMKMYAHAGITDFIILCGYKGYVLKEYFANYFLHTSDVTIDTSSGSLKIHRQHGEHWTVTLINTGEETQTGGRLKRASKFLSTSDSFCFTYGDGLSDVNLSHLIDFHEAHGKLATMTVVRSPSRYGSAVLNGDKAIIAFQEKPSTESGWINGGFFVLRPGILNYIEGDLDAWERSPLKRLSADGQLMGYQHEGFWQAMDTLREKLLLEKLWNEGRAPWKRWQ